MAAAVARAPAPPAPGALAAASSLAARLAPAPSLFSVDVVASALAQRRLLRAVHCVPRGALYEVRAKACCDPGRVGCPRALTRAAPQAGGPVLREALRRYDLFLELLAAWTSADADVAKPDALVPPLDCAWLWHLHKLSPTRYAADCKVRVLAHARCGSVRTARRSAQPRGATE